MSKIKSKPCKDFLCIDTTKTLFKSNNIQEFADQTINQNESDIDLETEIFHLNMVNMLKNTSTVQFTKVRLIEVDQQVFFLEFIYLASNLPYFS